MSKITIIGCGHGGQALASELILKGYEITIYADKQHPGGIAAIKNQGGINCQGEINNFAKIANTTHNLKDAIKNSEYIFIVVPSFAHKKVFVSMAKHLKANQTIITLAANFASLSYLSHIKPKNDLIDIASLPYVCRSDNNGSVEIISIKNNIGAAAIPAKNINKHLDNLSKMLTTKIISYPNVLSLGMNITSGLTHPAVTILNAGRIGEDKPEFYFYKDGITSEIARIIEICDKERIEIGKKLGVKMYFYLELMEEYYGIKYKSIYDFFKNSKEHNAKPMCPPKLTHRYITQDVAGLLVAWVNLGKASGTKTPYMQNLVNISSMLNNKNYMTSGTTLEKLNLQHKNIKEILDIVHNGKQNKLQTSKNSSTFGSVA